MKDKRPPYSKISVQPGERFLSSIGYDYWNTESSARRVAEEAERKIESLRRALSYCLDEMRYTAKNDKVISLDRMEFQVAEEALKYTKLPELKG